MVSCPCRCKELHSGLPSLVFEMLQWDLSWPVIILVLLFWNHSNMSRSFLAEDLRPGIVLQVRTYKSRVEGQNCLLNLLITLLLMQPRIQLSFWAAPRNFFLPVSQESVHKCFGKLAYFIDSVHGESRLISISQRPRYSGTVMPSVNAWGLCMYPSHTTLPQDDVQAQSLVLAAGCFCSGVSMMQGHQSTMHVRALWSHPILFYIKTMILPRFWN